MFEGRWLLNQQDSVVLPTELEVNGTKRDHLPVVVGWATGPRRCDEWGRRD